MILTFADFTLNSNKKELLFKNEKVILTKQNYDLLLIFLNKDGILVSKSEIIQHVWKGRVVADNTVDKSFTKLKKVLNSHQQATYFESQYGRGMKFIPIVTISDSRDVIKNTIKNNNSKVKLNSFSISAIIVAVILISFIYLSNILNPINQTNKSKPLLLIIPSEIEQSDAQWWSLNNTKFIQQILGDSHNALIKDYKNKPQNLDINQYLDYQWKIAPELKVLTSKIKKEEDIYTLEFVLKDSSQNVSNFSISNNNFNELYLQANKWLMQSLNNNDDFNKINLPNNQILIENYLRGLAEIDMAKMKKQLIILKFVS